LRKECGTASRPQSSSEAWSWPCTSTKAPPRQGADFRATQTFEQLDAPVQMFGAGRSGADQDQLRRVCGMAGGVGHRHHAAERCAEHDRIDDAKHFAEDAYVVAPLHQIPALARAVLTAAVAAMVEIDDLANVSEGGVGGPVDRVVGAGTAVKHQQHRLFPHHGAVGDELGTLDVEEQPHPVHGHMHGQASFG
jgi:hypothetical protein